MTPALRLPSSLSVCFFRGERKSWLLFHQLLPGWSLILQPDTKEDIEE